MEKVEYKGYLKTGKAFLTPFVEGFDMTDVSVSIEDITKGSPKEGDMIARNEDNHKDKWLVAKEFFDKNYRELLG